MPSRTKRVFISDVHMGAGRPYDWLKPDDAKKLAAFLGYLLINPKYSQEVEEVVLLGDIFDNWICPVGEDPPDLQKIIDAPVNKGIIKGINALADSGITVTYLPGNHDMSVDKEDKNIFIKNFPRINFLDKETYTDGKLSAEHGHAYDIFNAPDPLNGGENSLPLGYYISRVVAYKAATQGDVTQNLYGYINYIIRHLGQLEPIIVFNYVLDDARLTDGAIIRNAPINGQPQDINAGEVKERYANLYDQWQGRNDIVALEAFLAGKYLWTVAEKQLMSGSKNIIIFGHSHIHSLNPVTDPVGKNKFHANSGTWCSQDGGKRFTFIETEKNPVTGEHQIFLN